MVVGIPQPPGPVGDFKAMASGAGPRPRVGGFSFMIVRRSGGIHHDCRSEALAQDQVSEDGLGKRRTANVAETNKQDVHG